MSVKDDILTACPPSVAAMLEARVEATPDNPAFLVPHDRRDGGADWESIDYATFRAEVHDVAAGLIRLGVHPTDRVGIVSSTRYEWIVADMAVACSGAAVTAIYPTCTDHDELFILQDSGVRVLVAENQAQVAKVTMHDDELGDQVRHIVVLDDDRSAADRVDQRVITWTDLRERGRAALAETPSLVTDTIAAIGPDDLAALIYTSGTTGRPKGVELTQRSMTFQGHSFAAMEFLTTDDVHYLWLPLSHVFGNCLLAAQWAYGFSTAVDGRVDRILAGLGETRPTVMCGVPRIFEKIRAGVITRSPSRGVTGRVARWAFTVGREALPYRHGGHRLPRALAAKYALADRLVFRTMRDVMGGRMRFMITGSAPLSRHVTEWFYAAGITVIEGYGSTEATIGVLTPPTRPKFGSIGPACPGVEVRLADDGEMLLRSPALFRGYHHLPEQTADVLVDGWFHTGDIAEMDEDGYLFITDRKKDMFKTSGGKYVAPQKVENAITATIPYVSQAVALGDGRKYVVALVTLEREPLLRWGRRHGHEKATYEELTQLPEIRRSLDRFMDRANQRLERWETVKRYVVLDHELTVDDGGVTPTQKVRRDVISRRYAHIVDSLYDVED